VDGSDPTYSEGLSQVFWESHQRELVDGSDPTCSSKVAEAFEKVFSLIP
jgi:hypothetical protein